MVKEERKKDTNIEIVELSDMYVIVDQKLKSIIHYHYNHKGLVNLPVQSINIHTIIIRIASKHIVGMKIATARYSKLTIKTLNTCLKLRMLAGKYQRLNLESS